MPFNPNLPIAGTKLDAVEMRAQFNGLKEFIDPLAARVADLEAQNANLVQQLAARPTLQQVLEIIAANAARNVDSVAALPPPWSQNPPDREEFNEVRDKVNEALSGLKHSA